MKFINQQLLYCFFCSIVLLFSTKTEGQNFGSNNLAILVADTSINNTTVRVLEIDKTTAAQTPIQNIAISGTGANPIRVSGSASSTLYASNSNDGSLLCFTGFNVATTGVNANTLNPRAVVTINNSGTIAIPTTYTGVSGDQTRAATTVDNTTWYIGDQGGMYTNSATAASPAGNYRSVRAFGGTVYIFKATTASAPVGIVSAATGGTVTDLPGLPLGASSRQDFYLVSSGTNGTTYDVLYILDATSATVGTIFKFSLVAGSWVANGSYTTSFGGFALAAEQSSGGINLFVSTGTGATVNNQVLKLNDAAGHNSTISINTANNVVLYTASGNKIVKGIAFAPRVPVIVPVFTQLSSQCSGQLFTLPTTSNNGIVGTWSPVIDTTQTATYTFTPNVGQNATTATMTVTVDPSQTPTFTQVSAICAGDILSALPTTSTNAISGTWSPALNNTATTTYTFTASSGVCINNAVMTITVTPKTEPTFTQVSAICLGASLAALPTTSNNGVVGTWSPAIDASQTTTYTFTPNAGLCADSTTMTITVNQTTVTPTFTQIAAICSGSSLTLPTTSNDNITGSWSPAVNNTQTTTYTFTPQPNQCASTTTMTVVVNQPVNPTFTAISPACSGTALSPLPMTSNNGINGSWSPALNNTQTTTYLFTPNVGQCADTTSRTIIILPLPTVSAGNDISVCDSVLPVVLNAVAGGTGLSYLWNTGATTAALTANTGGTYSITVTSSNGCQATDNITVTVQVCSGIEMESETLTIYPNPVHNTLFIHSAQNLETYIELISLDGKVLLREEFNGNSKEIDFSSWSSGFYILRVAGEKTYKIIKP